MTQKTVEGSVLNLSGYHFCALNPDDIKDAVKARALELDIKGTVLLSTEGINCFVAGSEVNLTQFESILFGELAIPRFELKRSFSDYVPFTRLLVKVKKEIITTGRNDLNPSVETAPYIEAAELKKIYDDKEDFVILDTRNDYEIKIGKFKGAKDIGISTFRKFVANVDRIPSEWKNKKIVTYCTGGIRCEKASALLKKQGFENVYQLKGGILKYFEECGHEHYEGECFVFDKRIGIDAELSETETSQCYACRAPLLPQDFQSEHYVFGKSCPKCQKL